MAEGLKIEDIFHVPNIGIIKTLSGFQELIVLDDGGSFSAINTVCHVSLKA